MLNVIQKYNIKKEFGNFCEVGNIDYDESVIETFITRWEKHKGWLYEKMSKLENFDKQKLRLEWNYDFYREVNVIEIDKWYKKIYNYYYKNLNDEEMQILRSLMANGEIDEKRYVPKETISQNWFDNYCESDGKIKCMPKIKVSVGKRTGKVVLEILKYKEIFKGFNEEIEKNGISRPRNEEFVLSEIATAFKPVAMKDVMYLSINPFDYMRMSFGNSWSSCYKTLPEQIETKGSDYGGCYKAGTIAYMQDKNTCLLYSESNEIQKGIRMLKNRQCIYINKRGTAIQSKMYGGDDESYYDCWEKELPIILNKIFNINYKMISNEDIKADYTKSKIVYNKVRNKFYMGYNDISAGCRKNVFIRNGNKEFDNMGDFEISEKSYYLDTGEINENNEVITEADDDTCKCEYCGRIIDEDDAYEDEDGNRFCVHCGRYDDYEERYVYPDTEMVYVENYGYVSEENAEDNEEFTYCENCDEWQYDNEDAIFTKDGSSFCCEDCAISGGYRWSERECEWLKESELEWIESLDDWVYKEEAIYSDTQEEYILKEDSVEIIDKDGNKDYVLRSYAEEKGYQKTEIGIWISSAYILNYATAIKGYVKKDGVWKKEIETAKA